jgi:uncharacterized protein YecE (DUF72 family)
MIQDIQVPVVTDPQIATETTAKWSQRIRVGTSSWSDRSLTHESDWFPKRSMKAAERIAFYANQFSVVEMENTYRFPPTPAVSQQWVERTPDDFLFDIQAWSLLTGQPTLRQSLWEDLQNEIRDERRDNPKLYDTHLSTDGLNECWARFRHAIDPLVRANKLGSVILRFPRWFKPRDANRDRLCEVRSRLEGIPIAIEFGTADWVESQACEFTFDLLEDLDIAYVCDSKTESAATTSSFGVVKLLGNRQHNENEWTPDWRSYRYSANELEQTIPRLKHLAESCETLHVLFGTCWKDDAVRNGELLQELLHAYN